jgi:hypothetical protein
MARPARRRGPFFWPVLFFLLHDQLWRYFCFSRTETLGRPHHLVEVRSAAMRGAFALTAGLLSGLFVTILPLSAADLQGRAVVHGGVPCNTVTEWKDGNFNNAVRWWISGWISAHNRLLPDTFDLASGGNMDSLVRSIEQYCKFNPGSNLGEAGVALVNTLQPNRQKLP